MRVLVVFGESAAHVPMREAGRWAVRHVGENLVQHRAEDAGEVVFGEQVGLERRPPDLHGSVAVERQRFRVDQVQPRVAVELLLRVSEILHVARRLRCRVRQPAPHGRQGNAVDCRWRGKGRLQARQQGAQQQQGRGHRHRAVGGRRHRRNQSGLALVMRPLARGPSWQTEIGAAVIVTLPARRRILRRIPKSESAVSGLLRQSLLCKQPIGFAHSIEGMGGAASRFLDG